MNMKENNYNNRGYDQSNIFNKLQEESNRKGYTINRGFVKNSNYDQQKYSYNENRTRSYGTIRNNSKVTFGKVVGGLLVIGGVSWALHKYLYTPIKNFFDDLQDDISVKPGTDNRIFDGNCRVLSRKEARELLKNAEFVDPSDITVIDYIQR